MMRPLRPLIVIAALAGCQQPGPATDPFLYRSTIPPPGGPVSAAPVVTPGPQPYYSGSPAAAIGPSPCTPCTPAPICQPAAVPVAAPLPQRYFPSRGGFDFPQSLNGPPPAIFRDANVEVAADGPEPSAVRIVEPTVQGVVPAAAVLPIAPDSPAPTGTSVNYPGDRTGANYGYDPGYKVLRGKLDYSVTSRLWRLRYLPLDGPIDEYGGAVVIADSRQVAGLEPGDFVVVHGVLSPSTATGNSATYAISRIKRQ